MAYFISDILFDSNNVGGGILEFKNFTFKINNSILKHCLDDDSNTTDLNIGGLVAQIKEINNTGSYNINIEYSFINIYYKLPIQFVFNFSKY